jgi:hypothetical protein
MNVFFLVIKIMSIFLPVVCFYFSGPDGDHHRDRGPGGREISRKLDCVKSGNGHGRVLAEIELVMLQFTSGKNGRCKLKDGQRQTKDY